MTEESEVGGKAPIHLAVQKNQYEIVRILLDAGAYPNIRDAFKNTPLILASKSGYEDIVDLLINYGADINMRDNFGFNSAYWAQKGGYTELVGKKVRKKKFGDKSKVDKGGPLGLPRKLEVDDWSDWREMHLRVHYIKDRRKKKKKKRRR